MTVNAVPAQPTAYTAPKTAQLAPTYSPDTASNPIWKDAIIDEVDLSPYVNEKGELVAASKKYVVRRPGGWNPDAVRNSDHAYIPSENLPSMPGTHYTPGMAVTGDTSRPPAQEAWSLASAKDARVTGVLERSQQTVADKMCAKGEVAVWDDSLGAYFIIPQSMLMNTGVSAPGTAGINYQASAQKPVAEQDSDVK